MKVPDRHHAVYTFERSVWKARCRLCGCEVSNPDRRQAAAMFRQHIRAARAGEISGAPLVIDLRADSPVNDVESGEPMTPLPNG
jgi:hypothetical protein